MDTVIAGNLGLLIIAILVAIMARRLSLPHTVCLFAAGMALALGRFDFGVALTHDIILELILPPLLFEASRNIHWHEWRRDMPPILVYSILGVVISAAIVAIATAWIFRKPAQAALAFNVLIAATDSVGSCRPALMTGKIGKLPIHMTVRNQFYKSGFVW